MNKSNFALKERNGVPFVAWTDTGIPQDIEIMIRSLNAEVDAWAFHQEFTSEARKLGYKFRIEEPVITDFVTGRVDVRLEKDGVIVMIELDRILPRSKSILKLLQFENCQRAVIVRNCKRKDLTQRDTPERKIDGYWAKKYKYQ